MPATVTLSSTTLKADVSSDARLVQVDSTSGLTPGVRLFVDGELMAVVSLEGGYWVKVLRGVDGTAAQAHRSNTTAYIGRADQFYAVDPSGTPPDAVPVSPYINVINGNIWLARGDVIPGGPRYWQKQSVTYGQGALGIPTTTYDPSAST